MSETLKEFDDLLNIGVASSSFTVGSHVIAMKTINYEDMIGVSGEGANLQTELLARSIQTIDNKPVELATKLLLLKKAQVGLVNLLMAEYEKMIGEHDKVYEGVKKNISQTMTKKS